MIPAYLHIGIEYIVIYTSNMYRLLSSIGILSVLLLATGCTVSSEEFSAAATSEHDGYRIQYPKNWFIQIDPSGNGLVLSPKEESDAALLLSRAKKVRTPLEVAKSIETIQKMGTPDVVTEVTPTTLGGQNAARVTVLHVNILKGVPMAKKNALPGLEGSPGSMVEIVADAPKSRFNLAYTVLDGDRKNRQVFESVIESFAILQ
jgi:hypothetical protein